MFSFLGNPNVLENSVLLFSFLVVLIIAILMIPFVILVTASPMCQIKRYKEEEYFVDENAVLQSLPSLRDKWSVSLSVIVPAYNEEVRLKPMLEETLAFLIQRQKQIPNFTFEIIVVNDGSTDKTCAVASEFTKTYGSNIMRVLNLTKNRGKGGAVRLGVLNARGVVILFADADGATKFTEIVKLEKSLEQMIQVDYTSNPEKADQTVAIACGSRAHMEKEAIASRSYFRTILMFGFHFLVWMFTVDTIKDTQCGFKMFTREAAMQCFYNMHVERWAFDVEVLYIAQRFHIPVSEVAVRWTEVQGSKIVPIFSWLQMALDLFLIWFRYFIGAWDVMLIKS